MGLKLMAPLYELADIWVFTCGLLPGKKPVTLATLGARVHKDAKLFERLDLGGTLSVPRYEALIDYLADRTNWPGGFIPGEAAEKLRSLGIVQPGERLVVERSLVERQTVREG